MKLRQKLLRCILAILLFSLCYLAQLLPGFWGLEWIVGWPMLLAKSLPYTVGFPALVLLLRPFLPLRKMTKDQKKRTYIFVSVMYVLLACFSTLSGLSLHHEKVDHYLCSPQGKNRAVILTDDIGAWGTEETVYPVRAWLLYAPDKGIYLQAQDMRTITYAWTDENTLEIVRVFESDGETLTNYIRW